MNPILLYLLLLKATLTSFSGLSSLPAVRNDLVVDWPAITDRQLNTAVAIARVSPRPFGLYLVPVGYYAGGWTGAVAGFCAMATPAFLILVLLGYFARRTLDPRALAAIRAVTHASAGLVLASVIPIARDALTTPWQAVLALAVTGVMVGTDWDTAWTVLAGALCGVLLG
jgi:chromate transporter